MEGGRKGISSEMSTSKLIATLQMSCKEQGRKRKQRYKDATTRLRMQKDKNYGKVAKEIKLNTPSSQFF